MLATLIVPTSAMTASVTATVQGSQYDALGDRAGRIIVRSHATGQHIVTLDMPPGVVRSLFLLAGEKTIVASQAERTMFWELPDGRLTQTLPTRIYAFSHAVGTFITATPRDISVMAYPSRSTLCRLASDTGLGIERLLYSPDDRHLAVVFASGQPSDDAHFPGPNPVYRSISVSRLFDLSNCREVAAFTQLKAAAMGVFAGDGRYYDLHDAMVDMDGSFKRGSWRFDLAQQTLTPSQ